MKTAPQKKNVIVEEELDVVDKDDTGNLEDFPTLALIDKE